ncbi:MAG: hypothetical protein PWQ77_2154 [Kosmotogales bacterium]|nr:hypothetical protein [Kosmotogales bacterium]
MNDEVIKVLTKNACATIRLRFRKEILEENPDINEYLGEILDDKRIKYVFTWQNVDGYLGDSFHGGWIPHINLKHNTGSEAALRFLSEMGVPENNPVVENCLNALLKDNWNPDPWVWSKYYKPEIGLFGANHIRAVVFSYFGIEEHDFIKAGIKQALETIGRIKEISSIEDIVNTYRNKLYFSEGIALPDIYQLKLLAFTKSWRSDENISTLAKAMSHFIELSPVPHIYIKCANQLVAPAEINSQYLKCSPYSLQHNDWFWWLNIMEILARMGIIKQIPVLKKLMNDLKKILRENDGFFPDKPYRRPFEKWGVYSGMALEESWKNNRWKYDLTFRAYLILKYAGMI